MNILIENPQLLSFGLEPKIILIVSLQQKISTPLEFLLEFKNFLYFAQVFANIIF